MTYRSRLLNSVALIGLCVLLAACGDNDNPVESGEPIHADAFGVVLLHDGSQIAQDRRGVVDGQVEASVGRQTDAVLVRFLDEQDERFVPGEEWSLAWESADETIVELTQLDGDDRWSFRVVGNVAGETTIRLKILHGDHADFVSRPITVRVNDE